MTEDETMRMHLRDLLAEIEDTEGRLTPEAVVEAARNPDHPLHDRFDWNDASAAHANRLATARRLIASVQVRVRHHRVVLAAPAYVRDPTAAHGEQGYRAVRKIRDDAAVARAAIIAEMERVSSILRRTRALCIALGAEAQLDVLETEVSRFVASMEVSGSEVPPPSGAS